MSKIRGITFEFSADSSRLESSLKSINKETRETGRQLRDINKLLKFEPKNVELLAQKHSQLSNKIKEANEKLETLKKLQADMDKNGIDENSKQYQALRREIIDTESLLGTYKQQLKEVNKEIENNTKFSKKLAEHFKETGDKLQEAGKKIDQIGKDLKDYGKNLSMKVTAPIAGFATLAVKNFSEAESAWARYARTSGKSQDELQKIMKEGVSIAKDSVYSSKEVAEMMEYMALAGWSSEDSLSSLNNMLKFVTASGLDAGHASDIVTDNLTAFGLEMSETDRLMNVMLKTQSATNTNTEQLAGAYSNAAATAGALGYSIEDTSIALGILANSGLKGEQAGTKLRSVMTSLTTASESQKKILKELGVEMYNADGSAKPLMDTIGSLREKFSTLTEEEKINYANKLVGKNNVNAFMIMMNASNEEVNNATEAIKGHDDALTQMSDVMGETTEFKLKELKKSFGEMTEQIGAQIVPILLEVTEMFKGWIQAFSELDEGTKEFIVKAALIAATVGPIIMVIGSVISGIGKIISVGGLLVKGIGSIIGVLGGPLTLAIGAIVATGVVLYKNWDTIKEKAGQLANTVSEKWNNIKNWTSEKWGAVKNFTSTSWNSVKTSVSESISSAWSTVSEKASSISSSVSSAWGSVKRVTGNVWGSVKTGIIDSVSGAWNGITGWLDKLKNAFNFSWSLPKPRLPKISVTKAKGILGVPYPKFSVSWNRMGGIFKQPTVLPTLQGLQGFAEPSTGGEAIMPLNKLPQLMADAMEKVKGGSSQTIINYIMLDGKVIGREVTNTVDNNLGRKSMRERLAGGL